VGSGEDSVRVALPEADASELQRARPDASVRLASAPGQALHATLLREGGGAAWRLPSAALSARHGGDIQTDPGDDLKPLQPVVLLDLRLEEGADGRRHESLGQGPGERLGERAWVRFDAGYSPLAMQVLRALQRQVQQRFNAQF
jgi:putative peptide zinc metalloprotease protein